MSKPVFLLTAWDGGEWEDGAKKTFSVCLKLFQFSLVTLCLLWIATCCDSYFCNNFSNLDIHCIYTQDVCVSVFI